MTKSVLLICPAFNEALVIEAFYRNLTFVTQKQEGVDFDVLFVVDKSTDGTNEIVMRIAHENEHVSAIFMTRRFGHQAALMAGIDIAENFDAVIMLDTDLQHPPELIPDLISRFEDGFDIVSAVRKETEHVSFLRRIAGRMFYGLINKFSDFSVENGAADFRLISQKVVRIINSKMHEKDLFLRGMMPWIGFEQSQVEYEPAKRGGGDSKYNLSRMLSLALSGIVSTSLRPLFFSVMCAATFIVLCLIYVIYAVIKFFVTSQLPSGWTSIVVLQALLASVNLFAIGVVGAYVGVIFREVKGRPRYIIENHINNFKRKKIAR